jgi:hypothetical protein
MWNYDHVDGAVHVLFPSALVAVESFARELSGPHAAALRRAIARLKDSMGALPAELPRLDAADERTRAVMRTGYVATLELARLLEGIADEMVGTDSTAVSVLYHVLDFLEEWRPYISTQDAALHLVMFDGMPHADAIAILEGRATDDEEPCPICAAMGLQAGSAS